MDIMLSPLNGYDVVQQLQRDSKLKKIPFAFISLVAKEIKGKIPGALAFLSKPVTKEEIADLLRNCLAVTRKLS